MVESTQADKRQIKKVQATKRRCLLVLGMHRSGTSALTRVLSLMGADLPRDLIGISEGNERGHWESQRLVDYHDRMLSELGSSWHDWRPLEFTTLTTAKRETIQNDILEIVNYEYSASELFIIKDPRICRFARFFIDTLKKDEIDVLPILAWRNPLEVIQSLQNRSSMWPDGYKRMDAGLLWLSHVLAAEFHTRGSIRAITSYDNLLGNWKKSVEVIERQLGMEFPVPYSETEIEVEAFLEPNLRHHSHNLQELILDPQARGWLSDVFDAIRKIHSTRTQKKAEETLDRVRQEFQATVPILDAALQETHAARQENAAIRSENENLRGEISIKENIEFELLVLRERIAEYEDLEATINDARELLTEMDTDNRSLVDLVNDRVQIALDAQANIERLNQNSADLQQKLEQSLEFGEIKNIEVAKLRAEVGQLQSQTTKLQTRLERNLIARKGEKRELRKLINERKSIVEMEDIIRFKDDILLQKTQELEKLNADLNHTYSRLSEAEFDKLSLSNSNQDIRQAYENSTSWKITSPLRKMKRFWHSWEEFQKNAAHKFSSTVIKQANSQDNISDGNSHESCNSADSDRLSDGYLSNNSKGTVENRRNFPDCINGLESGDVKVQNFEFVPKLDRSPPSNLPVRLIAFYLPQYHPIPENDLWWGKNFTEWTNVVRGHSLFRGHYQPHVPGELGYYDLRSRDTFERQVEIAKTYGIGGFCFYYYWFGGETLLESPLQDYLERRDLDLPFCLCWANENWTRTWDGLESEILKKQDYNTGYEAKFISNASKYIMDKRYIRINGKPLLIVYRPSDLPDPKKTSEIWRNWCRENGIGEIYLAYTQSFDSEDPKNFGFDAAIEFPPNNSEITNVTDETPGLAENFSGQVYQWNDLVERSESYQESDYALFRCVNPGWDNSARRGLSASIVKGSTPDLYQQWLENAIGCTIKSFDSQSQRLVFANAWNEWAEGAHLEPDMRYGYAYLQATRNALEGVKKVTPSINNAEILAVIVHAFYPDVLEEILVSLTKMDTPKHLFVSAPRHAVGVVETMLHNCGEEYDLLVHENRGRDVLPFLKLLRRAHGNGHKLILKVHTKKSLHRMDGADWRNEIFGQLLDSDTCQTVVQSLQKNSDVGLVGPDNHIVSMKHYYGSNKENILELSGSMGLDFSEESLLDLSFIAGTMFFAHTEALMPLLKLKLNDFDFPEECGQTDGTLAHALERLISVSCLISGRKLLSVNEVVHGWSREITDYKYASQ